MSSNKQLIGVRLRDEDRKLLKEIAKRYDISESDVIRIAIRKFAKDMGIEVG
ncbi:ribbon-helix-helix domain-containing protein [Saccharolobus islandicus]|nr:ribbon-helix-helix protein, CopG family [Sulfolobus islandicus]